MATTEYDPTSGFYRIRFRYAGRTFKRSLKTNDPRIARSICGRVEETLALILRGRLEVPDDAEPGEFILSDGKRTKKAEMPVVRTLAQLFDLYSDSVPAGAKEANTLEGEKRHMRHIKRHLRSSSIAQSISTADLQRYVALRSKDQWNGQPIQPDTIKKELTTFRLIWNWAVHHGHLKGTISLRRVQLPLRPERPPFMTFAEIRRRLGREKCSEQEAALFWECLFLSKEEVEEALSYVASRALPPIIYPMTVLAAHTGARRSELLRSEVDDIDFESRVIKIREKKKSRSRSTTFRSVPMTERLEEAMADWLQNHPGGKFTLCERPNRPLEPTKAQKLFRTGLTGHADWARIRGFHTFRHSFASNLATEGIDQRLIDDWMGHQTEEMRRRYRHLLPNKQRAAIDLVFARSG